MGSISMAEWTTGKNFVSGGALVRARSSFGGVSMKVSSIAVVTTTSRSLKLHKGRALAFASQLDDSQQGNWVSLPRRQCSLPDLARMATAAARVVFDGIQPRVQAQPDAAVRQRGRQGGADRQTERWERMTQRSSLCRFEKHAKSI